MQITLADNLRMLRQKEGYSLEAVAEIIDMSRQAVAKWEMGESLPDLSNTVKLATLFKVSLDMLVLNVLYDNRVKVMGMPEAVMALFDIRVGENVLLLADKEQGIALMKCPQFGKEEFAYRGFVPVKMGPSGKILAVDLIFQR